MMFFVLVLSLGDLGLMSKHGSLHQYLLHLHDNGRTPITVFWWGTQRVVSICSPQLFKDTMKLTYRPSMNDINTHTHAYSQNSFKFQINDY